MNGRKNMKKLYTKNKLMNKPDLVMNKNIYAYFNNIFNQYENNIMFISDEKKFQFSYGKIGNAVADLVEELEGRIQNSNNNVLIIMDNRPEFFVAFTALLMAGVTAIIVNPQLSMGDINELVLKFNVKGIICISDQIKKHFDTLNHCFVLDGKELLKNKSDDFKGVRKLFLSTEVLYIMFSSGSTGQPKGVMFSKNNFLNELNCMSQAYSFKPDFNHLCVLPMYHASALFRSILLPFIKGSKIIMSQGFDCDKFLELIKFHKINFVQVVPTILSTLLSSEKMPSITIQKQLSFIGSASASHSEELIKQFENKFNIKIAQGYGLTETTCGAFLNLPDSRSEKHIGSVGKPIGDFKIKIIDENGTNVDNYKNGEIVLSGSAVSIGYFDGEMDSSKSINKGEIFTGDIGYLDDDGYLFLNARKSEIIHRAGFKISPTEVENIILTFKGINEAFVFGIPHELLGEDIIAYISCCDSFEESQLRSFLKNKLPKYKIPTRFYDIKNAMQNRSFKTSRNECKRTFLENRPKKNISASKKELVYSNSDNIPLRAFKHGSVVYLRPLMEEDIKSNIYLDNIMNPEVQFYTYSGRFPQSEFEIRKYWEEVSLPDSMTMAICDSNTHEYVGNIALRIDWIPRIAEFGRMIFKAYQDKPYSIEALKLLISYSFEDLCLKKLWGGGANPRSLPSLFKLGFKLEGRLRSHHFIKGCLRDIFQVGILVHEYESKKNNQKLPMKKNINYIPDEILSKIKIAFKKAFVIESETISLDTSPVEIDDWDSLGMIVLWSILEDTFNVEISSNDMISITNVYDIAFMIEGKLF